MTMTKQQEREHIAENTTYVDYVDIRAVDPQIGDEITFERAGLVWTGEVLKLCGEGVEVYIY